MLPLFYQQRKFTFATISYRVSYPDFSIAAVIKAFNKNYDIFSAGKSKMDDFNRVFIWMNAGNIYSPALFIKAKLYSHMDYRAMIYFNF